MFVIITLDLYVSIQYFIFTIFQSLKWRNKKESNKKKVRREKVVGQHILVIKIIKICVRCSSYIHKFNKSGFAL